MCKNNISMKTRNEYLKKVIRPQYLRATKKEKGVLLDKAEEATGLKRRYLMEKLKPSSNLDKSISEKRKRKSFYIKECFFGDFRKEVILPEETDPSRIKADIKEGILLIKVPKIEREKKRKIEI